MLKFERSEFTTSNRILGNYLAMCCWISKVDGVVLNRVELEGFFHTALQEPRRIEWLLEDVQPWFPLSTTMRFRADPPASLYLSRVALDKLSDGSMTDEKRVETARSVGIRLDIYESVKLVETKFSFPSIPEIQRKMLGLATGDLSVRDQFESKAISGRA